jgi:6-phosphogluconolactonase
MLFCFLLASLALGIVSEMSSLSSPRVRVFPLLDTLSFQVAEEIVKLSNEAVRERGKFTVAISGGSLPALVSSTFFFSTASLVFVLLFSSHPHVSEYLREDPFRSAIDWGKWFVFFVDERYVPHDHADSNFLACEKVCPFPLPVRNSSD